MAFPDTDLDVLVEAFLGADPRADPGSWPAATDLSDRLLDKPIQGGRGRPRGMATAASGSYTLWLNNDDGHLTPLHPNSPYYGTWDIGTPMRLSVDNVGASPPYPRVCGYIAAIEPLIVPGVGGVNLSVVKVTLGGLMRQRTQGSVAKSAMRRYYEHVSPSPAAYWPLELGDERANTEFGSGLPGGTKLKVVQSTLFGVTRPFSAASGVSPGPPGAASATDTSAGGRLSGVIPLVSGATHTRAEISMLAEGYENTFPGLLYLYNSIPATSGQTRIGVVAQDLGSGWQIGVDWTGPSGSNASYASGVRLLQDNEWHLVQLDIMSSGGGADTDYIVRIDGEQVHIGTASGLTWAPPVRTDANTLAVDIDRICHYAVWSGTTLPAAADSWTAFQAHIGELAEDRFARLCTEDGVPYSVTGDGLKLGRQPTADIVGLLRDIEAVDHGVLWEILTTWGFGYRCASDRYNLDPAMTIDLATYEISSGSNPGDVLRPIRNDQGMRNEWTVTGHSGNPQTVKDEGHQARHGVFTDSDDLNAFDDDAALREAGWRVHEDTYGGQRFADIPLDLGANPTTLLPGWLELDLADRVDRTNHPPEAPPDTVSLRVDGYAETIGRKSWRVRLSTTPDETWRVNVLAEDDPDDDDPYVGWLDYDSCELAADVDETDASWSIACSPEDSSDPDDFPRRHFIGGEEITVTASTGGTTPTWTVVRSENGIEKPHSTGAAIELADPIVLAL